MAFGNATKGDLKKIAGGGGGGGTTNYSELSNKPQINGVTLDGNKTSEDLGITGGASILDVTSDIGNGVDCTNYNAVIIIGRYFNAGTNKSWCFSGIYPISMLSNDTILTACDDHSNVYCDVSINNNIVSITRNSQSSSDRDIYKIYLIK
jgi:hypothetical protein